MQPGGADAANVSRSRESASSRLSFAQERTEFLTSADSHLQGARRALGPAIMSGTFTSPWVYLLAPIVGGIAAALLYSNVVAKASAPTMDDGDPQTGKKAGDRTLATGNDVRNTPTP